MTMNNKQNVHISWKGGDKMVTKLKIRRVELGLKQNEVAKQAGITSQYLRNLETGKASNPSIAIMKRLASILGCTEQELFF